MNCIGKQRHPVAGNVAPKMAAFYSSLPFCFGDAALDPLDLPFGETCFDLACLPPVAALLPLLGIVIHAS